jgi:hypothetical protein
MLDLNAVRAWAVQTEKSVGKRGRLPKSLIAAYLLAHPKTAREVARTVEVAVGKRGRISPVAAAAIAEKV